MYVCFILIPVSLWRNGSSTKKKQTCMTALQHRNRIYYRSTAAVLLVNSLYRLIMLNLFYVFFFLVLFLAMTGVCKNFPDLLVFLNFLKVLEKWECHLHVVQFLFAALYLFLPDDFIFSELVTIGMDFVDVSITC